MTLRFTKGHGTENDFVLVPDLDAELDLTPSQVALLADRQAGIGGDGVIRIVRTADAAEEEVRALAGEAEWFMDYRNHDGSLAQMCGNGTRVFATWLRREGLVGDEFSIATRAGLKGIRFEGEQVVTHMGQWRFVDEAKAQAQGFDALVHVEEAEEITEPYSALSLDLGNPHTVVALPPNVNLNGLRLRRPPAVNPCRRRAATSSSCGSWGPAGSRCASTSAASVRPAPVAPACAPRRSARPSGRETSTPRASTRSRFPEARCGCGCCPGARWSSPGRPCSWPTGRRRSCDPPSSRGGRGVRSRCA